jgi:hypothetical protein
MITSGFTAKKMEIQERDGSVTFAVRVAPRASRNAIEGEYQGALKVRLTAPPVDDRANEALRELLAEALNVPLSAVRIVSGLKNRTKRIAIAGVPKARIAALIAPDSKGAQ